MRNREARDTEAQRHGRKRETKIQRPTESETDLRRPNQKKRRQSMRLRKTELRYPNQERRRHSMRFSKTELRCPNQETETVRDGD